jgi:hypothetical protein
MRHEFLCMISKCSAVLASISLRRLETPDNLDQKHAICNFSISRDVYSVANTDFIGNPLRNFEKNGVSDQVALINF